MSGPFAERKAARDAATEGLFHLQSGSNYACYTSKKWYSHASESDVIIVTGKSRVFDLLPGEEPGKFLSDGYWSSDYLVVLDKPDTELFNLRESIPTHVAEGAHIHTLAAIGVVAAGFFITLGVSLLSKEGWWSVAYGMVVAIAIMIGFSIEYRVRVLIASVAGWRYVRNAVKSGRGTREHYRELVAHLSNADEYVVADVNKHILRWL